MLDRADSIGWPSQLEQVDLFLRKHTSLLRVKVQQLCGAELASIEIDANATLQDLRAAISGTLNLDCKPNLQLVLVLDENVLKDEFSCEKGRWKCLSEYGITTGATICLVKQEAPSGTTLNIVLQRLPEGDPMPIKIRDTATLQDLEQSVRGQGGLFHDFERRIAFAISNQKHLRPCGQKRKILAEYGIGDGTTLVWRFERPLHVSNKENLAPRRSVVWHSPVPNGETLETSIDSIMQQSEDSREGIAEPCTPTRRSSTQSSDVALSACKEITSREAKANKMLKRL